MYLFAWFGGIRPVGYLFILGIASVLSIAGAIVLLIGILAKGIAMRIREGGLMKD